MYDDSDSDELAENKKLVVECLKLAGMIVFICALISLLGYSIYQAQPARKKARAEAQASVISGTVVDVKYLDYQMYVEFDDGRVVQFYRGEYNTPLVLQKGRVNHIRHLEHEYLGTTIDEVPNNSK